MGTVTVRLTLRVLPIALGFGLLTTLITAWAPAIIASEPSLVDDSCVITHYHTDERGHRWAIEIWAAEKWQGPATTAYASTWVKGQRWGTGGMSRGLHPAELIPKWTGLHKPSAAYADARTTADQVDWRSAINGVSTEVRERRVVTAYGWPWRSLWCGLLVDPRNATYEAYGGIDLDGGQFDGDREPRILPMMPRWNGLIANIVAFSAMTLFLLLTTTLARRAVRRRRGRCWSCGYARVGIPERAPCPECGAT